MARVHAGAVALLRERYKHAAQAGEWQACADTARQMLVLVHDLATTAETSYALGYALEMLGDTSGAETNYQLALFMNRGHDKARRRLRRPEALRR